ncbi:Poly(rC)-binding protein [Schistosoma japonicum]|nr:Poly(rC)-binding protein [Schistosoma japonicum]
MSVVPSYTIGMSGDIIPNNFDMMPYSTFHTALLPHPNPIELGNAANISTGLMLATQQPTGQNPYCPPITLTNGYYTNATYPNNAESFCYVQSNDANSLLNAYHTYPTSMNLPLHATNISCDKLYTSSNHINNNSTAQNALLPTVNTNHITMNNNNNNKSELTNRLEIITIEKSNSLLDDSSNGIIDKSTTVSSSSSSSTTTTTTITTHGENVQHNTSLLVLRLLMSGKTKLCIITMLVETSFSKFCYQSTTVSKLKLCLNISKNPYSKYKSHVRTVSASIHCITKLSNAENSIKDVVNNTSGKESITVKYDL